MSIQDLVRKHEEYRRNTLNMQASENYLSPRVREPLSSDLASRYSMIFDTKVHGSFVHNAYGGTKYQEEILSEVEELGKEVFGFENVNIKPISGHAAAMAALLTMAKKRDKIMAISPEHGGYDGYSRGYLPNIMGLKYRPLKIREMREIDTEDIEDFRPNLIILGASYILFPYNLKEILDMAEDINAEVIYDASHVLGLIPAGFQKNIEDCSLVYGSTHKSYPGPQGGIAMSNQEEVMKKFDENLTWRVQDNYHMHRIASLGISLEEFKPVSKTYGKLVAKNSKSLAEGLHQGGVRVKYPPEFSESHQILIEEENLRENFSISAAEFGEILERNGIIVDRVGRLGTAELTWKGYGEKDMRKIANLIIRAAKGEDVKPHVRKIVEQWNGKTLGKV